MFAFLKLAVLRQLDRVPSTAKSLSVILDRPRWQIDYALASLEQRGAIELTMQGYWKPKQASRSSTSGVSWRARQPRRANPASTEGQ